MVVGRKEKRYEKGGSEEQLAKSFLWLKPAFDSLVAEIYCRKDGLVNEYMQTCGL